MDSVTILQIILSVVPSLIVGLVAYSFFNNYVNNEEKKRLFALKKQNQKSMTPRRIQALERMTLFLERIDPGRLLIRVKPVSKDAKTYETLLIQSIESEFEHNLTQQIFVSDDCWSAIRATKNATITLIRKNAEQEGVDTADKLREIILKELIGKAAPSATGLAYIKKEVKEMW